MVKVVDAADDAQTNYSYGYYILRQEKKESSEKWRNNLCKSILWEFTSEWSKTYLKG